MADYYRDVIALLKAYGFGFKAAGAWGSRNLVNPQTRVHVTVDRKLKSKFTANGILKEAGLPKAF